MQPIRFDPNLSIHDVNLLQQFRITDREIIDEPMLFQANEQFAWKNGGPLTKICLLAVGNYVEKIRGKMSMIYKSPIIDTKVVMLMPEQYPCIPGWHCDNVPRNYSLGQPDLSQLNEPEYHITMHIDSCDDLCNTLFINKPSVIHYDEKRVWGSIDEYISKNFDESEMTVSAKSGQIAIFNRATLHRCEAARDKGWRFFFRLSFTKGDPKLFLNMKRNQVQVYTTSGGGW